VTSRVVVLDDDPTGTQAAAGARVLIDTSAPALRSWFADHPPQPVYVSTNTRALSPGRARDLVARVADVAATLWPGVQFVCRGDSTLRGHVREEYQGLAGGAAPALLLVPAMPSAGRVTVGGRHYLVTAGGRVPVAETEYARDPHFGYADSDLLHWAERRSGGFFAARRGVVLRLAELRDGGPAAVAAAVARVTRDGEGVGEPAVVACDACSDGDLATIADGIRRAWQENSQVIVRCAPPLAALLTGSAAAGFCPPPTARRLLVVVGSYVQASTLQLAELSRAYPGRVALADLAALGRDPAQEQSRLAGLLERAWAQGPVAIMATPRVRADIGPESGLEIARRLAGVVAALAARPDAVVVRGGVTSAVMARFGLGATEARVAGPVMPGVVLWRLDDSAGGIPLLIAAGNIGQPGDLAALVGRIAGEPGPAVDGAPALRGASELGEE
jgi:uncharacterized protein YgbK (DUF1537 family)